MAYVYQSTRDRTKQGDKAPWSVGWYDSAGRKRSKKVGSKSLAEKYRRKVEGQMAAGLVEGPRRTKWSDFRQRFTDTVLATKSPGTVGIYTIALDNFERIAKPVYLDAITTEVIDAFKARRMRERRRTTAKAGTDAAKRTHPPVAPATVNRDLRHVRAALRKAHRWGLIQQPPFVELLREPERDPYFVDDDAFAKLYGACGSMTRPGNGHYPAADWWRALLTFAYLTGWRIGEILELRREDVDLDARTARVDAEHTKGRREARIELHPIVVDHLRAIWGFGALVFPWPLNERTLHKHFDKLKAAAEVEFPGAFHRFRFAFANANIEQFDEHLIQMLMRHRSLTTTRHYINEAKRMRQARVAERLHVPEILRAVAT